MEQRQIKKFLNYVTSEAPSLIYPSNKLKTQNREELLKMTTKKFNYDLEKIYSKTNNIVRKYQDENTSKIQKEFLVADLLEVTEQIVKNNCKRFIRQYTITAINEEELYAVAISQPLIDALNWFDFTKGDNFLKAWHYFMMKRFWNELKEISTKKAMFFRNNVCSSDRVLGEGSGSTICDLVGESDFSDKVCTKITLLSLIEQFEKIDRHGKVIRCLVIKNQQERTEAFKQVLGSNTYGSTERKQVQRVKGRFREYVLSQGYTA